MTKASELQSLIGQEVGVSRWFTLDQARIDAFAGLRTSSSSTSIPSAPRRRPSAGPSRTDS